MYVLVAVDEDQRPTLIQADSLESLNGKINDAFGDWEQFSDHCMNAIGYRPEDLFSLWKLENGMLVEEESFGIRTRPIIVI
jgi:hypothetical protein